MYTLGLGLGFGHAVAGKWGSEEKRRRRGGRGPLIVGNEV
jgi:hypothetical protein